MGVRSWTLHRKVHPIARWDVWPFIVLHSLNLIAIFSNCESPPSETLGVNVTLPGADTRRNFLGCSTSLLNLAGIPVGLRLRFVLFHAHNFCNANVRVLLFFSQD
jgi:hypothetical protein